MRHFLKQQQGASAAEFGLVLLPVVVLFVVIMQFGLLFFVQNDMYNAAREAARRWASNEAALTPVMDAPDPPALSSQMTCGSEVLNSVTNSACQILATWSFLTFQVGLTRQEGVSGACDEVRVLITTPMADATLFNIFGIFDGKTLTAMVAMRSQYDILEAGEVSSGDCV